MLGDNNVEKIKKEISNMKFLSIEGPLLSLSKSQSVYLGLSKAKFLNKEQLKELKLILKKDRNIALKELRSLLIPLARSKIIINLLMNSGLHRTEVCLVLSIIKRLLLDLFKRPFSMTNISELTSIWGRIPLEVRRLIIAIIILKQEIIHRFLLDLRKEEIKTMKRNKNIGKKRKIEIFLKKLNREDFMQEVGLNRNMIDSTTEEEKNKIKIKKRTFQQEEQK